MERKIKQEVRGYRTIDGAGLVWSGFGTPNR